MGIQSYPIVPRARPSCTTLPCPLSSLASGHLCKRTDTRRHCIVQPQRRACTSRNSKSSLVCTCLWSKSASNIDFGITNKLANAKFRIVNSEYQLCHVCKGQNCHDYLDRCRKSSWYNSAPFHDKLSQQLVMKGNFLSMIKGIYQKPTPKIILHGSRPNVECFPPKIRKNTRKDVLSHHFYLTLYLRFQQW